MDIDTQIEQLEAQLSTITLAPHDVIVLESKATLHQGTIDFIEQRVRRIFPAHDVLMLNSGLRFGIIHRDSVHGTGSTDPQSS